MSAVTIHILAALYLVIGCIWLAKDMSTPEFEKAPFIVNLVMIVGMVLLWGALVPIFTIRRLLNPGEKDQVIQDLQNRLAAMERAARR